MTHSADGSLTSRPMPEPAAARRQGWVTKAASKAQMDARRIALVLVERCLACRRIHIVGLRNRQRTNPTRGLISRETPISRRTPARISQDLGMLA
jgi:hypothetical protein